MSAPPVIENIRGLNLPARCKAELFMLWRWAGRLGECILRFLKAHREFGEALVLGCVVAYLLSQIPWIGGFLALCALVTAASIGLLRELREDVTRFFEPAA
ncbi:MAG: hypothetical protein WCK89_14885 [bacterium]